MTAALAEDPRGMKRICPNCGTHYYDLNKRPIICPSCSNEFSTEIKIKTRRSRSSIDPQAGNKADHEDLLEGDDLLEEDESEEDVVSLDDLDDEGNDSDVEDDSDDLDLDDEDDDLDLDDDLEDLDDEDDDLDVSVDDETDR
ncbi:MAG: TIGR02300 family protein [Rhodospirillales bacterium]|nr:TIGR02300 family protein [Rhodospirillales bacterium]